MLGQGEPTRVSAPIEAEALGHVPALDGIRAVAVAAVLLFHGEITGVEGGFLGVSVFFTLSGFLITSLLLRQWAASTTDPTSCTGSICVASGHDGSDACSPPRG